MTARPSNRFAKLERQIAADERGGILKRWYYGRAVLEAKGGRRQLPDGMIAQLIKAAGVRKQKSGKPVPALSEREIQYRVKLATVYGTDQQVRKLIADLGSWSEIIKAGFPEIDIDPDPDLLDELDELERSAPDSWEQLSLIPGLGETLNVAGRRVPLAEATVADVRAHRDMYRQIHENYSKRLALIEAALSAMEAGSGGDDTTRAVEAYQRGAS